MPIVGAQVQLLVYRATLGRWKVVVKIVVWESYRI